MEVTGVSRPFPSWLTTFTSNHGIESAFGEGTFAAAFLTTQLLSHPPCTNRSARPWRVLAPPVPRWPALAAPGALFAPLHRRQKIVPLLQLPNSLNYF